MKKPLTKILTLTGLLIVAAVGWKLVTRLQTGEASTGREKANPVPVETAEVEIGPIDEIRVFSGSLESSAKTTISPTVAGRVLRVNADIAQPVTRGQVLVELETAEFELRRSRAEAELAVARAQLKEASNRLEIARREQERIRKLNDQGISSSAALDNAKAEFLIRSSALEVAKANVAARESDLQTAALQLQETRIRARWSEGDDSRVLATRQVEEGDTVSPYDPLFTVVEIQPLRAVVYVPERDYSRLQAGQQVRLTTDAWPGRDFPAAIHRVSPVFREESRQARVEILAENPESELKPGMFVRAHVTLDHIDGAVLVPEAALTRRGDLTGVFTVDPETQTAHWQNVRTGILQGGKIQIIEPALSGSVITLGQQLVDEGSPLLLPESPESGE